MTTKEEGEVDGYDTEILSPRSDASSVATFSSDEDNREEYEEEEDNDHHPAPCCTRTVRDMAGYYNLAGLHPTDFEQVRAEYWRSAIVYRKTYHVNLGVSANERTRKCGGLHHAHSRSSLFAGAH